jgi:hypothetical protein
MPNDNTHDMPNEGRAILRNGEAGLRQINFPVVNHHRNVYRDSSSNHRLCF